MSGYLMLGAVSGAMLQFPSADAVAAFQRQGPSEQTQAVTGFLRRQIDKTSTEQAEIKKRTEPTGKLQQAGQPFKARLGIDLMRASIADQGGGVVTKEVPPSKQLKFVEKFRQYLTESVGQRFDMSV